MAPMSFFRRGLIAFCCGVAAASAGLVSARAASSDETAIAEDPAAPLEEVVVTAQRREENLQKVPIAITALSQESLDDNNIKTLEGLQYQVPSLSLTTYSSGRDQVGLVVRGQGGATGNARLSSVLMYLNEVPVSTNGQLLFGGPGLFFDLENIQALKGPQGTLFGRNTTGGALLLQTARPADEFGGSVQATYGNYNDRELSGAVNLPLVSGTLLARIAFTEQKRDGFTKILSTPAHPNGVDADNRDFYAVRGTLTWRLGERFQNETIVTQSEYSNDGSPSILVDFRTGAVAGIVVPSYPGYLAQQNALGHRTSVPLNTSLRSQGHGLSLENITRVALREDLVFRNILGADQQRQRIVGDLDGSPASVFENQVDPTTPTRVHAYSEEAQLLGNSFGGKLDWIVGAFYYDSPALQFWTNNVRTLGGNGITQTRNSDKSKAAYTQGTYDFTDALSFTAGARYTKDEYAADSGPLNGPYLHQDASSNALTWNLGVQYQIDPRKMVYVAARRGYRAGGANKVDSAGNPLPDYDPESVTDGEIGLKSDWSLGGSSLRVNIATYYQKYRDIQVLQQVIAQNGAPTNVTANAAAARVWGAELEATLAATRRLEFGVSADYLDFEYTAFGAGVNSVPLIANLHSARPRSKYSVNGRYQLPFDSRLGDVAVKADWNWQADMTGIVNAPIDVDHGGHIPSFGLLNGSINWDGVYGSHLDASLFVSNALNKEYIVGARSVYSTALGFAIQTFGEPRMYGVRLRYNF